MLKPYKQVYKENEINESKSDVNEEYITLTPRQLLVKELEPVIAANLDKLPFEKMNTEMVVDWWISMQYEEQSSEKVQRHSKSKGNAKNYYPYAVRLKVTLNTFFYMPKKDREKIIEAKERFNVLWRGEPIQLLRSIVNSMQTNT